MMDEAINDAFSDRRSALTCPNCGATGLTPVYKVANIPAHSCLLMSSREEATEYPRGTLTLDFCAACAFLCNTSYDPQLKSYSPDYEETQHFSACFDDFARRLAQHWVDQYDLRGKTILEIGCGKGQFLEMLCKLGDNRGIGVDPACRPDRLSMEAKSHITLIQEYYSDAHADIPADVICCRHTLEHIHDPREFLSAIRRNIGKRTDTLMLFELPDTTRILKECAFWDIYYEHCSYFTAGSLARLFRLCGFDLLEVKRDYGNQYLILTARPTEQPTKARFPIENDLEQTTQEVLDFKLSCDGAISQWREKVNDLAKKGSVVAWGGGSKCVAFFTTLQVGEEVDCVIDINPFKHGQFLPGSGHEVVAPEHLLEVRPRHILVMNPIYCQEIEAVLQQLGVTASLVPVC